MANLIWSPSREQLEAKLPLLWCQVLRLAQRQVCQSGDRSAAASSLHQLIQHAGIVAEHKAGGWGLLSAIGIGKQLSVSVRYVKMRNTQTAVPNYVHMIISLWLDIIFNWNFQVVLGFLPFFLFSDAVSYAVSSVLLYLLNYLRAKLIAILLGVLQMLPVLSPMVPIQSERTNFKHYQSHFCVCNWVDF